MKYVFKKSNLWILSILLLTVSCKSGEDNFGIKKSDCTSSELYEEVGYGITMDYLDDPSFTNCNQYVAFSRALIRVCEGSIPEEYQSGINSSEEFLDGFSCETTDDLEDLTDFIESSMPK